MDQVQEILNNYAGRASYILHDYLQLTTEYFEKSIKDFEHHAYVLRQLPISCHLTSESSLILIGNVRMWDNEILIRSIMEGTIKFIYLTLGDGNERDKKISEFWSIMPEISEIKRTKRAKDLLSKLPNSELVGKRFLKEIILEDEVIKELEEKYPRKYRKELEQRWSYSEIVNQVSAYPIYQNLSGTFHSYGIGSQLTHQDANAIRLLIDHNGRAPERREAKEIAHGCRQISDILTFAALRYFAYKQLHKESTDNIFTEQVNELLNDMNVHHKAFSEIEEQFENN